MCDIADDNGEHLSEKSQIRDLEESNHSEKETSDAIISKLSEKLASNVLSLYYDDMKKTSASLSELTRNQSIVQETLEQENTRVTDALQAYSLDEMFSRIKLYNIKAQQLKKDMILIHDRTLKLKKRALKLQQQKQKEALQKELKKDRELERDKMLAPKIAIK